MNWLRCATHTVTDANAAAARFGAWMDYRVVEKGIVSDDLATAWNAPANAVGVIHDNRRVGVLRAPEGSLVEVVEQL